MQGVHNNLYKLPGYCRNILGYVPSRSCQFNPHQFKTWFSTMNKFNVILIAFAQGIECNACKHKTSGLMWTEIMK